MGSFCGTLEKSSGTEILQIVDLFLQSPCILRTARLRTPTTSGPHPDEPYRNPVGLAMCRVVKSTLTLLPESADPAVQQNRSVLGSLAQGGGVRSSLGEVLLLG